MSSLVGRRSAVAAVIALLVAGLLVTLGDRSETTIRARFVTTEGLNVNDDVRVLGVSVGKITAIENAGGSVLVTMAVGADQPIPTSARAAIVSPSLVSGRFIQLDPVWSGGDRLDDGATIGLDRTAVPVSFDEVKEQLTELADGLGPARGRGEGALADTIAALDSGLKHGNSRRLRSAVAELRGAAAALSDGRSDLFGTVRNLNTFTRTLAVQDAAVRGFTQELGSVSGTLAANRQTLVGVLQDLADVLGRTKEYLHSHGGHLTATLEDVNLLSAAIADRSNELAGVFHVAPHTLIDLHNSVENQALSTRPATLGFENVAQLLCGAILGAGGTSKQCTNALGPLIDLLGLAPGGAR